MLYVNNMHLHLIIIESDIKLVSYVVTHNADLFAQHGCTVYLVLICFFFTAQPSTIVT